MSAKGQFISSILIICIAVFVSIIINVSGAADIFKNIFRDNAPKEVNNINSKLNKYEERFTKLEEMIEDDAAPDNININENLENRFKNLESEKENLQNEINKLLKEVAELKKGKNTSMPASKDAVDHSKVKPTSDFEKSFRSLYGKLAKEEKLKAKMAAVKKMREQALKAREKMQGYLPKYVKNRKNYLGINDQQAESITELILRIYDQQENLSIKAFEEDFEEKIYQEDAKKINEQANRELEQYVPNDKIGTAKQYFRWYFKGRGIKKPNQNPNRWGW